MSGKKQHYIPQSLLRGFQSSGESSDRIKVYRRGQDPFFVRTDGISAERYFYSDMGQAGERTLDDEITDYESQLAEWLKDYRQQLDGAQVDGDTAAQVATHLAVRAAYIRGVFGSGFGQLLDQFGSDLADEEESRYALGVDALGQSTYLEEALRERLTEIPEDILPNVPRPLLESLLRAHLRETYGQFHREMIPGLLAAIGTMAAKASEVARDGHAKALAAGLAPAQRVEVLKKLRWHVMHCSAHSLILPDCVVMAVSRQGEILPLLLAEADNCQQVLLPLSHDRLLVGSLDSENVPEVGLLRGASAASSWKYFISSPDAPDLQALQEKIQELPTGFLHEMVRGVTLRSASRTQKLVEGPTGAVEMTAASEPASTYEVLVFGAQDSQLCGKVAPIVEAIRGEVRWGVSLTALDSVAFVQDLETRFSDMDMGMLGGQPVPAPVPYQGGDVVEIIVGRNGAPQTAIVAKLWVAEALVEENSQHHDMAIAAIVHAFAEALYDQHLLNANPDVFVTQAEDPWDSQLFPLAIACFKAYCANRVSAPLWQDKAGMLEEGVIASIQECDAECKSAVQDYQSTEDLNALLDKAGLKVGQLLCRIAAALGHSDGQDTDPGTFLSKAMGELTARELDSWLSVFHRDLRARFLKVGTWRTSIETATIKEHVNRHFWRFGILPWTSAPGETRVMVHRAGGA